MPTSASRPADWYPNNPADRLARVLKGLRTADPGAPIKEALSVILGAKDDRDFATQLGYLFALPGETEELLREVIDPEHDDLEWHLQWRKPVGKAFAHMWSFTSPVQSVVTHFGTEHVAYLEGCGHLLRRAKAEPRISIDKMATLVARLEELYDELSAAEDVPAELRAFILRQLDEIRRAVREYPLRGVAALSEVFHQNLGATIANDAVRRAASEEGTSSHSWVERWKKFMAVVGITAGTFTTVLALPAAAQDAADTFWPPAIEQKVAELIAPLNTPGPPEWGLPGRARAALSRRFGEESRPAARRSAARV